MRSTPGPGTDATPKSSLCKSSRSTHRRKIRFTRSIAAGSRATLPRGGRGSVLCDTRTGSISSAS